MDKYFKAAIIKMPPMSNYENTRDQCRCSMFQRRSKSIQQRNRKHDKEPIGNFRTEKGNNYTFKMLQVGSRAEWRTGRKESMNLKIEQEMFLNLKSEQQRENGLEKKVSRASGK